MKNAGPFVLTLFLLAVFLGPAHAVVPGGDHAPPPACQGQGPAVHFDTERADANASSCAFCLHGNTGGMSWNRVILHVPVAEAADLPLTTGLCLSHLSVLPLLRAPPAFPI